MKFREIGIELKAQSMANILVIDDDPLILECFRFLDIAPDVKILTAATAEQGIKMFAKHLPEVVLIDVHLPDDSGLECFRRLHRIQPKTPVILMTGQGTAESAIESMRLGAFEYLLKPFNLDQIQELLIRALSISRLMRVPAKVADLQSSVVDDHADILVGQCPAMQEVYKSIGRVAPQDVTVLILGESGTGKELVARAIYHYSKRSEGPFMAINCAAIPDTLLESELFGHEKGAFTGAERRRIGKFEQCDGGTLFLDEVGDMAPLTQAKILRVLQDQTFERVGGNVAIKTNVRLIAATNRPLEPLITSGQFRSDLYYRLNVYTIRLPQLSERTSDIPSLSRHFLQRYNRELNKQVMEFTPEAMQCLQDYAWPGNVRELQSVIKQALLQSTGPAILPEFLPIYGQKVAVAHSQASSGTTALKDFIQKLLDSGTHQLYDQVLHFVEKQLLEMVLHSTQHNQSEAARILGISRSTLRTKMLTLGFVDELDKKESNSG